MTAISIGVLGSLHCAGMCAPLMIAVNPKGSARSSLLHHGGRILTYALFGATAGALGSTFNVMGLQQYFSIGLGVLLISVILFLPLVGVVGAVEKRIGAWSLKLTSRLHKAEMGRPSVRFLTGMINGILPCGLVYLAMAGAAATFTPWDGALFMVAFGVGTLPILLVVTKLSMSLSGKLRTHMRTLIPVAVFIMGSMLLVRGLNLGIPYLSPKAAESTERIAACE